MTLVYGYDWLGGGGSDREGSGIACCKSMRAIEGREENGLLFC